MVTEVISSESGVFHKVSFMTFGLCFLFQGMSRGC